MVQVDISLSETSATSGSGEGKGGSEKLVRSFNRGCNVGTDPCCLPSCHSEDPTDSFHHLSLKVDHQILYGSSVKQVTENREAAAVTRFLVLMAFPAL